MNHTIWPHVVLIQRRERIYRRQARFERDGTAQLETDTEQLAAIERELQRFSTVEHVDMPSTSTYTPED